MRLRAPQTDAEWRAYLLERSEDRGDCRIWNRGTCEVGYGKIGVRGAGSAHRLSYRVNVGPIPRGMQVCHSCDVPGCIKPEHLWIGTAKDNLDDRNRKNRHNAPSGKNHWSYRWKGAHPRAKLTWAKVNRIRSLYKQGFVQTKLAQKYGVRQGTISAIVRKETWVRR